MSNENEILFKQAINEALSNKFQREIDTCDEEIVCSRRHMRIMRAIVYGNALNSNGRMSTRAKVAAILVAAALLLGGCAIAYREAIRAFISEVKEFFVELTFSEGDDESRRIEEVYELTYIPEGYSLENENIARIRIQYVFKNTQGHKIKFLQQSLDNSSFTVDSENGDNMLFEIDGCKVYSRTTNGTYYYLWNNGKYAFKLNSTEPLSNEVLVLIVNGIKIK